LPKQSLDELGEMPIKDYIAMKKGGLVYHKGKSMIFFNGKKRVIIINFDPFLVFTLMTIGGILSFALGNALHPVLGWALIILWVLVNQWRKHRA
jgi:hypothetical protein